MSKSEPAESIPKKDKKPKLEIVRDSPKPLTPRQNHLIDKLASFPYPTLKKACEDLGVPYSTARRWQEINVLYVDELTKAHSVERERVKDGMERRIQALADPAVAALAEMLKSEDSAATVRAAALIVERVLGKPKQPVEVEQTGFTRRYIGVPIEEV